MAEFNFLKFFPKDKNGMFIIYEIYSFINFFKLLLKNNFSHEKAFDFILTNCSMSAIVWQEYIHNKKYRKLSADDALLPKQAAVKARVVYDFMTIAYSSRVRV
ncbi:MAG: hypothetical protein AAB842_01335 [Patescibacteria group bacterium]